MLKKLLLIILALSLILGMSTMSLGASQSKFTVVLNGTTLDLKDEVYTNKEGKLMLPLRKVAETLGYDVKWNGQEQSIDISKESEIIKLKIGESNIIVKEGKTFVPVKLFSDAMNLIVGWDNKQQRLKINQPKENPEEFFGMAEYDIIQTKLNNYMKALEENQNFYGSVLVAKEGKILLNQGFGFSDLQQNTKNKSQTKFAIGSVTKQFTAMGIMQLVEKDLIKVEDKVSKYIPNVPHSDKITIHNLLTHTSGLKNYTNLTSFLLLDTENKDPMAMVDLIKDLPLEFEPGEKFEYSNTNYLLLGMIIENISGMSLEDYLGNNIFKPLNMEDSGIFYGKNDEIPDATPYTGYLEVEPVDDELVLTQAYGAGNIYSTVEDLYRWDRGLQTEQLVKKQTLDKIFKEHIGISETVSYGYGWMVSEGEVGKIIYHGGNTFGFTSNIARYIDKDLTIIILTNKGVYDVTKLTNVLTAITLGKDYKIPELLKEMEIKDPGFYDKYIGKYDFISGTYMDIIKKDDGLYGQVTGQNEFRIFPQTKDKFFAKEIDVKIEFKENDKGEVTEFIFKQMGLEITCKRAEEKHQDIVELDPIIYDKYVGEYNLAPGMVITIIKEDNRIYAQLTNQDKYEIFPMSENEFFYKVVDAKITFIKDDDKVIKLILNQNGQDIPATKTE